jgi:hypothetical protein
MSPNSICSENQIHPEQGVNHRDDLPFIRYDICAVVKDSSLIFASGTLSWRLMVPCRLTFIGCDYRFPATLSREDGVEAEVIR